MRMVMHYSQLHGEWNLPSVGYGTLISEEDSIAQTSLSLDACQAPR